MPIDYSRYPVEARMDVEVVALIAKDKYAGIMLQNILIEQNKAKKHTRLKVLNKAGLIIKPIKMSF